MLTNIKFSPIIETPKISFTIVVVGIEGNTHSTIAKSHKFGKSSQ